MKMEEVFGQTFHYVDDLYYNVSNEKRFDEGIELTDMQALDLLRELKCFQGELCVITDFCYLVNNGPFIVNASELGYFVQNFEIVYKESFYSTDIIIISFSEKLIWVLFHEGIYWLSKS